jgi:transcription initiation factor TFIIIB Brf1 subunit/transcription initiation factor TFIIB
MMHMCCWPDPCPDCKTRDIIIDGRQGEAVCSKCGLVVASHLVSDEAEFRSFKDDMGVVEDNSRVGAAIQTHGTGTNALTETLPQSTIQNDKRLDKMNRICAAAASSSQHASRGSAQTVSETFQFTCSERLRLPQSVITDAVGMYEATKQALGAVKNKQAALEAVCVFYACKAAPRLKVQKSKEQVCAAFHVPLNLFLKVNIAFTNAAQDKPWYKLATDLEQAPDMLPPLLNKVGTDWSSRQRMAVTRRVTELYTRHSRAMEHLEIGGVLAAMLWVVCNSPGQDGNSCKVTKARLAQLVGVTHTTISNNIKLLSRVDSSVLP